MKRLIKILSVTTICLLLVFGCFACNGHVHTFDKDTWASNETTHWHPATCEHTDEKDSEAAHIDENNDGKCDVCQKEMSSTTPPEHTHEFDMNKWESDENTHWHPATCGHPEQKNSEAAHIDEDEDGKCDVCQKEMTSTNPPSEHTHEFDMNKWESDETTHWHPATCGHPEQKNSEAAHIDEDEDGKCDVCQKDMPSTTPPEHTHEFDMNKWESDGKTHWHPADCDDPTHRGNEAEHIDEDNNNECDVCGRKLAAFYTETVGKIIDKIATGKNFTLTLNAKINGTDNSLSFKFAEDGFDCPTFKSKELHDEEGNLVGIVRTTISMRDNAIYVLDATYDVNDGTEAKEPSTKILNKVALPEEIKDLGSLFTTLKEYIKTQLADVDLSFLNFEETDNGYELYCDTDIADIVNTVVGVLYGMKDTSLNEVLSSVLESVLGFDLGDIASLIEQIIPAVDDKTVGELVNLLDGMLLPMIAQSNLADLLDSLVASLGIDATPQSIYGILSKLNLGVDAPQEGETLGAYIVKVLQSGKIGAVKLDDIVKKITGDETATVASLLTKLADFLKNTTISDLLSFIPFDELEGMTFTQFKLYLKLDVDKEYAIQSFVAGLEGKYTSATATEGKQLELSCGLTISDRETTELSVIETSLLDNNLKFADDNVFDSTLLTTVVKALAKKYIGGTISIDELKTYYTKIVTLIKSSSLNEKVFTNLGFVKSEPDRNGITSLTRDIDLTGIVSPLLEMIIPADAGDVAALDALLGLISADYASSIKQLLPILNMFSGYSVPQFLSMLNMYAGGQLTDDVVAGLLDTVLNLFGVDANTVYEFVKKYDASVEAPKDQTAGAYFMWAIKNSADFGKVSLNTVLTDIGGTDFNKWYENTIIPIIGVLQNVKINELAQKLSVKLTFRISFNAENTITKVECGITYSIKEGENYFFELLGFSANLPKA